MPLEIDGKLRYNTKETAKILQTSPAQIRFMLSEGRIEGIKIGNMNFFTMEQIDASRMSYRKKHSLSDKEKDDPAPAYLPAAS